MTMMPRKITTKCGIVLELGAQISGVGTWRDVYEIKNKLGHVVKIARTPRRCRSGRMVDPRECNARELQKWKDAPPDIKDWLVPVIAVYDDGAYLVQERGEPAAAKDVATALKDAPLNVRGMGDWKAGNFVRHKGRIKRCDYE